MAKPDPILDSKAFNDALAKVFLTNRDAYRATVYYFIHGMNFREISEEMRVHRETVTRLISKAKDLIRAELEQSRPELLDVSALRDKQAEDLARFEVDEINKRFPFANPAEIVSKS